MHSVARAVVELAPHSRQDTIGSPPAPIPWPWQEVER